MAKRIFGNIPGYPEGSWFATRAELSEAGLHRPLQAGISGSGAEGCDSIVLSGGYEDDVDNGSEILYTGHGGRNHETGKQVENQSLTRGNLALAYNKTNGLPVRVIRGAKHSSPFSPSEGYRYDGLFSVESYTRIYGRSGFFVYLFRLLKIQQGYEYLTRLGEDSADYITTPRQEVTVSRIIRDSVQARLVKQLHQFRCQFCGIELKGPAGLYAEAAHIRPLGAPHSGPDSEDNLLCLCPNHHVLFDLGSIAIDNNLSLIGETGYLRTVPKHQISLSHIRYHREHCFITTEKTASVERR